MSYYLFRVLFVALPLLFGVFLPLIKLGSIERLVNLFWGSIYGLGFYFGGFLFGGIGSRATMVLGAFLWPLGITFLLFWASGKLWNQNAGTSRNVIIALLLLSLFVVITLARSRTAPFSSFPVFTNFLSAAY